MDTYTRLDLPHTPHSPIPPSLSEPFRTRTGNVVAITSGHDHGEVVVRELQ
jgi:hypothetical protein